MAFRALLGLIVPLIISLNAAAAEIALKPSPPEQYTVVKGDTLWDISAKFLKNPWQWEQLWEKNKQIKNPHLIYPGDTIYFSIINGKPRLSFNKQSSATRSEQRLLFPHIRETNVDEAIPVIPVGAIAAFLSSPRIVAKDELLNSPYIVDFAGEHLMAGAGDRIYVRSITKPKNLGFTIFRQGETFIQPETGEILGYEAQYIAESILQKLGDPATLLITKSNSELLKGDRLMPTEEGQVALSYFPKAPDKTVRGQIISVLDGVTQIGQHNVVAIDKGTVDGIRQGHVLAIYQRGEKVRDAYAAAVNGTIKLPDEDAGTLMVFRTFGRVSYALVMEASAAIHVLDYVETP